MNKMHIVIALLLSLFVGVQAAAPTYAAVDAVYEWEIDTAISTAASFDSLVGTSDTVVLLDSTWSPDLRWEYILTHDAFVASGDSVFAYIQADCYQTTSLHYSVTVDSLEAEAGEAVVIPFGGTLVGSKFRLKLLSSTDNGAKTVVNKVTLWRRRPINLRKNW